MECHYNQVIKAHKAIKAQTTLKMEKKGKGFREYTLEYWLLSLWDNCFFEVQ